jgi:hypothetical protein
MARVKLGSYLCTCVVKPGKCKGKGKKRHCTGPRASCRHCVKILTAKQKAAQAKKKQSIKDRREQKRQDSAADMEMAVRRASRTGMSGMRGRRRRRK